MDDVRFVLDQHAELDIYSASSLKQQSAGKHVAPLGHIILIQRQPVIKNQLYCFWLDLTGARTYDLRHLRQTC